MSPDARGGLVVHGGPARRGDEGDTYRLMSALPQKAANRADMLGGAGVVVDQNGLTDFERLRSALAGRDGSRTVFLYAFDLIALDGEDMHPHPWETRRATLAGLLRKAGRGIRFSEHLDGTDGETVFRHACRMGLEGIVAKGVDRPYRSGRSPDWVKIKNPDAPAAKRVIEG
jgi:bifunctional non-homologous end joining protein LigD